MLYYVPLECYPERYTMQWAGRRTGWLERNWRANAVPFIRIDSVENEENKDATIESGLVLDVKRRTAHGFSQVRDLITIAVGKQLTSQDVIYFDDFWHPGIEMLPYTFDQLGISPRMFAFCHAQSVDEFDFTHRMAHWMRHFERGIAEVLSGVFVNSDILKDLLVRGEVTYPKKIHVVGHVFDEDEVMERMPKAKPERTIDVVFTSRWDDEKNPRFFLRVMEKLIEKRPHVNILICTSARHLRSNNECNMIELAAFRAAHPQNIQVLEGLTKEEYYYELCKSKVQMNTASQDFISIALLEASVAGCYPVYPNFRSFPQAFRYNRNFMYSHLDVDSACSLVNKVLDAPENWDALHIGGRSWIHKRHNTTWGRMTNIMFNRQLINVPLYA